MAAVKQFRSAFNGFNREDVVRYIELLNNQHANAIAQLTSQLQTAQAQAADPALQEKLSAAEARCAQLEAELEDLKNAASTKATEQELEAYRRAESAERVARERAQQIYAQANAVLADVTVKVESASAQAGAAAEQILAQLDTYRQTIAGTKDAFAEAVATLYAIRPTED